MTRIPNEMASLEYLMHLSLASNTLVGITRDLLVRCRNLEILSFPNNQVQGNTIQYCCFFNIIVIVWLLSCLGVYDFFFSMHRLSSAVGRNVAHSSIGRFE
jgi:hypothetical protein